jgi:hypothetical protein
LIAAQNAAATTTQSATAGTSTRSDSPATSPSVPTATVAVIIPPSMKTSPWAKLISSSTP